MIAHNRTENGVCEAISADRLIYQNPDDLIEAVRKGSPNIKHFDTSCFSNEYITGDIDDAYLERTETLRNDHAQTERNSENAIVEM